MMKKKILYACLAVVVIAGLSQLAKSARTDLISTAFQSGTNRNSDAWRIDSVGDLRLFSGDLRLGDSGVTPSTTAGTFPGLKVRFTNASSLPTFQGEVLLTISTATTNGSTTAAALFSTNTVVGIADGVYAAGAVGWMTVSGYALVFTTNTISPGDILVSSNKSVGVAEKFVLATSTIIPNSDIGIAFSSGTQTSAGGGLTLVKLNH